MAPAAEQQWLNTPQDRRGSCTMQTEVDEFICRITFHFHRLLQFRNGRKRQGWVHDVHLENVSECLSRTGYSKSFLVPQVKEEAVKCLAQ